MQLCLERNHPSRNYLRISNFPTEELSIFYTKFFFPQKQYGQSCLL